MNRTETLAILKVMKSSYQRFYINVTKEDATDAVNVWAMMFEDEDPKIVTEAVKALICTSEFPPTIADVKKKIALITKIEQGMTEAEAWNLVLRAVKNSGYHAQKEYENLPPVLQRLVGSAGQLKEWGLMDMGVLGSVVQSNFMRSYKARSTEQKQIDQLPESTKALMANLKQNYKMLEDKNVITNLSDLSK